MVVTLHNAIINLLLKRKGKVKINVAQQLKEITGKPAKDGEGKEILIRTPLTNALLMRDSQILKSTAEEKVRAFDLATEIAKNDEVDVTGKDIVFIEKRLEPMGALVYGQIKKILNQQEAPVAKPEEVEKPAEPAKK